MAKMVSQYPISLSVERRPILTESDTPSWWIHQRQARQARKDLPLRVTHVTNPESVAPDDDTQRLGVIRWH